MESSTSPTASSRRDDATLRRELPGGSVTTVHVATWEAASTVVRVERMPAQQRLVDWCSATATGDALVGGFYTRPEGSPLGELRIDGVLHESVPFSRPWDAVRTCLHVDRGVRIDRRARLGEAPAGDLLQAGPLLVSEGRVVCLDGHDAEGFSRAAHQFDSDITEGRHPRAAFGLGGGRLIAVACDGRADDDVGLTLGELAHVMADLGAESALNLDGGGSTSLVCDGRLRNHPREQHGIGLPGGRAITTAIAFRAA